MKNTGQVAGDEVAELYLIPPQDGLTPRRQLAAFERVPLQPGESRHVRFTLQPRQMSVVDAQGRRAMVAGQYTLYMGGGQPGGSSSVTGVFTIIGERALAK